MKYTIGFKSGNQVYADLPEEDGDFLQQLTREIGDKVRGSDRLFMYAGFLVNLNEVEFILPLPKGSGDKV